MKHTHLYLALLLSTMSQNSSADDLLNPDPERSRQYFAAANTCGVERAVTEEIMIDKILDRSPKETFERVKSMLDTPDSGEAGVKMLKNEKKIKGLINLIYKEPLRGDDVKAIGQTVYDSCMYRQEKKYAKKYEELK